MDWVYTLENGLPCFLVRYEIMPMFITWQGYLVKEYNLVQTHKPVIWIGIYIVTALGTSCFITQTLITENGADFFFDVLVFAKWTSAPLRRISHSNGLVCGIGIQAIALASKKHSNWFDRNVCHSVSQPSSFLHFILCFPSYYTVFQRYGTWYYLK